MNAEHAQSDSSSDKPWSPVQLLHELVSDKGRCDPFPVYERFRALGPAVKVPWGGFLVTSNMLCREVLTSKDWLNVDPRWRSAHTSGSARAGVDFVENTVLAANAPEHASLRKSFDGFLPTRMAQGARPMITDLVHQGLDAFQARLAAEGTADFAELMSSWLPTAVVCSLLGLPRTDEAMLRQMSHDMAYVLDLSPDAHKLRRADCAALMWEAYWRYLRTEPRSRLPEDGVLARWLDSGDAADLDERRVSAMVGVTIVGGHETTAGLLSNGLVALLHHPEQAAWLRAHPDCAPAAVEELLRFVSPAQLITRYAACDTELGDEPVKAGQLAHAVLAAANRDPEVFADPAQLDLSRKPGRHLAMGAGAHYCVGATLARLEAEVLFPLLLERCPGLALAGAPVYSDNLAYRGVLSMPLRVDSAVAPAGASGHLARLADAATTDERVVSSTDGPVLTVTLNRPDSGNRLDAAMLAGLYRVFDGVASRSDIRVVVLAGAGTTFGVGIDIAELKRLAKSDPARIREITEQADRVCSAIRATPQITIARVHGHVVGAGIALAACCDLRIAADTASFRLPEMTMGMPMAWGGVLSRLIAEMGTARVREMVLFGDRVDAATARRYGLVHQITGEDELERTSQKRARRLSRKNAAAIATTKKLLNALEPSYSNVDAEVLAAAFLSGQSPRQAR
ncbi:cytochrome P450 [Actinomadura macrotermitis]|uniref:1,4-dihydroxy-2-naphthoyl-CoA synthase n=1 Tax=Actinomadura macrotermitis TaxID=2585200 RepID=A0A7K0C025_9ACTN|nr:cytochrome P450 [Actinomadura macrotermitis]MQY06805.1 1,4-dihydroxy-2-naphthoyl-CoA synthase [Actinomadura macrotermitis]